MVSKYRQGFDLRLLKELKLPNGRGNDQSGILPGADIAESVARYAGSRHKNKKKN
jgi:hypothetical protein